MRNRIPVLITLAAMAGPVAAQKPLSQLPYTPSLDVASTTSHTSGE
jgi:hypothetical protein